MKNKKMVTLLAAGGMMAMMSPVAAQALTVGVEQADGTVKYYTAIETEMAEDVELTEDIVGTVVVNETFSRQLFKESLAYLKEYGVTYDAQADVVLYQGEKVRWLMDNQMAGYEASTLFSEDGTVDLYVERNEEGILQGVRKASQEEFSSQDAKVEDLEAMLVLDDVSAEAIEIESMDESGVSWDAATYELVEDSEEKIEAYDCGEDAVLECYEATAVDSGSSYLSKEEQERKWKKAQEYQEIGIGQSESGSWTWNGEKIYILMDEDGSFYQNGNASAKNGRLYVYVSRDKEGKALKAEVVSGKELLEKKALMDERERE